MTEVLFRIAACLIILAAPFALAAIATGQAEGILWLIFPMFAAIPAFLIMALIFVPVESALSSSGVASYKNWLVPMVGAIVAGGMGLLYQKFLTIGSSKAAAAFSWFSPQIWAVVGIFIVFGAVLGGVWRLSEWLAMYFGWIK